GPRFRGGQCEGAARGSGRALAPARPERRGTRGPRSERDPSLVLRPGPTAEVPGGRIDRDVTEQRIEIDPPRILGPGETGQGPEAVVPDTVVDGCAAGRVLAGEADPAPVLRPHPSRQLEILHQDAGTSISRGLRVDPAEVFRPDVLMPVVGWIDVLGECGRPRQNEYDSGDPEKERRS